MLKHYQTDSRTLVSSRPYFRSIGVMLVFTEGSIDVDIINLFQLYGASMAKTTTLRTVSFEASGFLLDCP